MMYLAYPPPDDEEQALDCKALGNHIRGVMEQHPDRFRMRGKRKPHRRPAVRKGSNDPLRLAKRPPAGKQPKTALPGPAEKQQEGPEILLRELLAEARKRGLTMDILAERAGYSERTLRRRLKTPESLPLGEFWRIARAARGIYAEGGRNG